MCVYVCELGIFKQWTEDKDHLRSVHPANVSDEVVVKGSKLRSRLSLTFILKQNKSHLFLYMSKYFNDYFHEKDSNTLYSTYISVLEGNKIEKIFNSGKINLAHNLRQRYSSIYPLCKTYFHIGFFLNIFYLLSFSEEDSDKFLKSC